jgi:hypothetical protein
VAEAGGIYLFDDDAAVQAFVDGPIIAEMKGDPTLSIKAFDASALLRAACWGSSSFWPRSCYYSLVTSKNTTSPGHV